MEQQGHRNDRINRTQKVRFSPLVSTGKEKDTETGYGYFGARCMDHELMTMWLSVDPMADKYPSISPYAYCAWNPVKLVDPDGRELVIMDGRTRYYYKNGHVYINAKCNGLTFDSRLGKDARTIKNNLDKMLESGAGKKVINRLINSSECYTISVDAKTGDGYYSTANNKVSLVSGIKNNMEALSHELFHAYQDDNGRSQRSIYNEVEAYVFCGLISGRSGGITSNTDMEYHEAGLEFANKLRGGNFDSKTFQYLLDNFKKSSSANTGGSYNEYSDNPSKYKAEDSLLKDVYK